jgi:hypothetical protein
LDRTNHTTPHKKQNDHHRPTMALLRYACLWSKQPSYLSSNNHPNLHHPRSIHILTPSVIFTRHDKSEPLLTSRIPFSPSFPSIFDFFSCHGAPNSEVVVNMVSVRMTLIQNDWSVSKWAILALYFVFILVTFQHGIYPEERRRLQDDTS